MSSLDSFSTPEETKLSGISSLLPPPGPARIDRAIAGARDWLLARQNADGFWCAELEGDTTCESYLILLEAFLGRPGSEKARALARVVRGRAIASGGFSQYPGGPAELSVSCLSYFALKIAGDSREEPHMRSARDAIIGLGGVERSNTYTKYHLAFFGQYAWSHVPAIPPEMMFLPQGSPFTVYDMSAWSRTIFVPLSILYASRPVRALPAGCGVEELFEVPFDRRAAAAKNGAGGGAGGATLGADRSRTLQKLFVGVDRLLKLCERVPGVGAVRRVALQRAEAWMLERFQDSDGLSAILPAMANSVMALHCLGYGEDHPVMKEQLGHLDGLLLRDDDGALRMQPCLSPVWDTVIASHALGQAGLAGDAPALRRAASWLLTKQCRRPGDWARRNPAAPGGWYFEHRNEFYPDVDDTCMALRVLQHARAEGPESVQQAAMERGLAWMLGMQNDDGGWASFDRGNDKQWLTEVPFADHNAMIDPSTADITGRVLECLGGFPSFDARHPVVRRAREFLRKDQLSDGCWYGRWGVNYIYGTWQVLRGLRGIGEDLQAPHVRRAVRWLVNHQNRDGGWGESIASYDEPSQRGIGASTPSQTAWALMGLIAAGEHEHIAVRNGVRHLLETQDASGTWAQASWTGTGFPRVFYLNYRDYKHTFPLMALGQYRSARGLSAAR